MTTSARLLETLPELDSSGRRTRSLVRRTLCAYLLLCLAGALPWLLDLSPALQAIGWGLWFPGAGFITSGALALLLVPLTLVLFSVSLFLWFGSGNILAPLAIWTLSALLAGSLAQISTVITPLLVVGCTVSIGAWLFRDTLVRKRKSLARRARRLKELPATIELLQNKAAEHPAPDYRELSVEDLGAVRYLLERGLAPVDKLEGLEVIEQFQPAALRYQIFDLQYSLALMQCHYTPNFHGYLSQAQRNLIEKVTLPAVCGYWKWESLWGHLSTRFDPVQRDNIMLTGFYLISLGLYSSNTGDYRYYEPGSLTFRLNAKLSFRHDTHSIAQALVDNFNTSGYCLYPCEPNWIYTFCNLQGMTGLRVYDRVAETDHYSQLRERFEYNWRQEFTEADGSVVPIRSSLTGLSIPGLVGLSGDCTGSVLAGAVLPDTAMRMWAQAFGESIQVRPDGTLDLRTVGADNIDPGNYRKGLGMTYTAVWLAAQEYGYPEIAAAAQQSLDEEYEPCLENGVFRYRKLSVLANAMAIRARLMRRDDWRSTILQGPTPAALKGPLLTGASYPEVLVARAVSNTGSDLELVLHPGTEPGEQTLIIERLSPNAAYRVDGTLNTDLRADAEGKLQLQVHLQGRTLIHLHPDTRSA